MIDNSNRTRSGLCRSQEEDDPSKYFGSNSISRNNIRLCLPPKEDNHIEYSPFLTVLQSDNDSVWAW